jgi:hypothetical protein
MTMRDRTIPTNGSETFIRNGTNGRHSAAKKAELSLNGRGFLTAREDGAHKLFDSRAERAVAFGILAHPDAARVTLSDLDPADFTDQAAINAVIAFIGLDEEGKSILGLTAAQWLIDHGGLALFVFG